VTLGIAISVLFLLCRPCYGTASTLTTQSSLRWHPAHFLWLLHTVWLRCLVVHGTSASSHISSTVASSTSMFHKTVLIFCYQPLLWYHNLTLCTSRCLPVEKELSCRLGASNTLLTTAIIFEHTCIDHIQKRTQLACNLTQCAAKTHADTAAFLMQGSSYSVGPCDHLHRMAWL